MKKALFAVGTAATSLTLALAQGFNINITNVAQQGQVNGSAIRNLIVLASDIAASLVPITITIAVLVFFWFLISFILKGDKPDDQQKALKAMGYSILAIFVMVSIWGIISFFGHAVGIGQGGNIPIPGVPVPTR